MVARPRTRVAAKRPRGFSMIELLVTIAVIAVLMSVLLPTLAASQRTAVRAAFLANQREAARIVRVYAMDYKDTFPSWGIEKTNLAPLKTDRGTLEMGWWRQMDHWGLFLTTVGYDGWLSLGPEAGPGVFRAIEHLGSREAQDFHEMMGAAFAEPARFAAGQPDTSVLLHSVRTYSEVRFPSAKGVLIEVVPPLDNGGDPIPISFADGHSAAHPIKELRTGVRNIPSGPFPVLSTIAGVRGRDIVGGD